MSTTNGNKPGGQREPSHNSPTAATPPATEAELDALRYRGTPIHRFIPGTKSQDAETSSPAAGKSTSPKSPKVE